MGHLLPTIQKMCFWFLRLLYGFHQQGAERLAGFLIEIYMGFMVLSCVHVFMHVFGHARMNIKGIFPFPLGKICSQVVVWPYSHICLGDV